MATDSYANTSTAPGASLFGYGNSVARGGAGTAGMTGTGFTQTPAAAAPRTAPPQTATRRAQRAPGTYGTADTDGTERLLAFGMPGHGTADTHESTRAFERRNCEYVAVGTSASGPDTSPRTRPNASASVTSGPWSSEASTT